MRTDSRPPRSLDVRRFVFVTLLITVAVVDFDLGAQRADQPAPPDFDVRTTRDAVASAYITRFAVLQTSRSVADLSGTQAAGLARLQSDIGAVEVVTNAELGIPEVVSRTPGGGFLTAPSADRAGAMRAFLSAYADAYGLLPGQAESLELVADYANPAGNMAWVEFEQRFNGLPVFRGRIRGGFTARGTARYRAHSDGRPGGVAGRRERWLERCSGCARADGQRRRPSDVRPRVDVG
jgi:hypothetical protein